MDADSAAPLPSAQLSDRGGELKRLGIQVALGAVGLSALIGVVAVASGKLGLFAAKALATTASASLVGLIATACARVIERRRLGIIPAIGGVLGALSFLALVVGFWAEVKTGEYWQLATSGVFYSLAITFFVTMATATIPDSYRWMIWLGSTTVFALATSGTALIWRDGTQDGLLRITVVSAIIAASNGIGVAIVAAAHRRPKLSNMIGFCPACGQPAESHYGEFECSQCDGKFTIEPTDKS